MVDRNALLRESQQLDKAIARARSRRRGEDGTTRKSAVKNAVLGAPNVRKGENTMGSRGYSFVRAVALITKALPPEQCRLEADVHNKLSEAMYSCKGWSDYRGGHNQTTIKLPLSPAFLMGHMGEDGASLAPQSSGIIDTSFGMELKSLMWAGTAGADPDEAEWLSRKHGTPNTLKGWTPDTQKVSNQSWMQQSLGGAVVPFPEMGPLVPLLRNKNACMSAGANVIPLPPSGRIAFPRQTSPTTGYHIGEGVKITQSSVNTDQFTLSAKKIGAYLVTNNELIRYGGPIVEQMFRNDMTVTLGLQLDFDILQGAGSDNVIAGLIGYPGVVTFTPTTAASGNNLAKLAPQDIYTFIGNIRSNNANFEGWIMKPELLYAMVGKRASVLASGDNLGLFLFDLTRGFNKLKGEDGYFLGGYGVTDSSNVPGNRVQGTTTTGTALYGGMWSDLQIAIYGTIEIATADQGDNLFPQDQTAVRAILSADAGPWHPGAFGVCDVLSTTIGS